VSPSWPAEISGVAPATLMDWPSAALATVDSSVGCGVSVCSFDKFV
jgi:hypothetical protein